MESNFSSQADYVYNKATYFRKVWVASGIIWTIIDYALPILSFLSSCIVLYVQSANYGENTTKYTIIFSCLSAVLVIASFCINPRKHKMVYRHAYIVINEGLWNTFAEKDEKKIQILVQCISRGERIISSSLDLELGTCECCRFNNIRDLKPGLETDSEEEQND